MNALVRSSYFLQAAVVWLSLISIIAGYMTFLAGQYWWVIINILAIAVNVHTFYSQIKMRKKLTQGFSKNTHCSCGACDWGTVIRQYDEVPICRNCWTTWKGK